MMNFATYNRPWLEEIAAQKAYITRQEMRDRVAAFVAEQRAPKSVLLPIPLSFDRDTFEELAAAGRLVMSAQTKILQHLYQKESRPELLRRFDFAESMDALVDWDELLAASCTISRIDVVPSNEGYYFCELNPDSSVGGTEVSDWIKVISDGLSVPLAEGMASPQDATVRVLRKTLERKGLQRLVICDWSTNRGNGYFGFDLLRGHLARAMPELELHLIVETEYREEWFAPEEARRTLVHRGFMHQDMTDGGAFVRRLRESGATVVNTFDSEIRMHKGWFALLCDAQYHPLLDAAEVAAIKRYLPHTVAVTGTNLEDLLAQKAQLVFKLNLSSGGDGVMMGADHSAEYLREKIEAKGVERWSAQQVIVSDGIDLPFTNAFEFTKHNVVLGLYMIDGLASGMMVRASSRSKVVNVASGVGGYSWAVPMSQDEQARHIAALRRAANR
jgi:hypothetical protein